MSILSIRDAVFTDIPFIARCTMAAVGLYDFEAEPDADRLRTLDALEHICSLDDTLYSYRHGRVAQIDGTAVGCLLSYRGEEYADMRERTFKIAEEMLGIDLSGTEMETGPGEFYLDSLAVIPSSRGHRIGERLILDGLEKAKAAGYDIATLIAAEEHPRLIAYYRSAGFIEGRRMRCFGEDYVKMYCRLDTVSPA